MQRNRLFAVLAFIIIAASYLSGSLRPWTEASSAALQAQATPGGSAYDLQRSIQINDYDVAGKSGAARGEILYFYKCWMCHNDLAIASDWGDKMPQMKLKTLFQRPNLGSGNPVNDENVADKIKNGGPKMPSFRANVTDADLADLVSYLKSGKCCLDGTNPPENPWYQASAHKWSVPTTLSGGPTGVVRTTTNEFLEGMMVQLIGPNGVRTTVYSNEEGSYEFPKMQPGAYTLRIAKPLEFKPFQRNSVQIKGTEKLEEIVLERIPSPESTISHGDAGLPPTPEIYSQLSGAEWLWNLEGSSQQKAQLHRSCGTGCHELQRIFRRRFDERSWSLMVDRMWHYGPRPLITRDREGSTPTRGTREQEEQFVKWLGRILGPDAKMVPARFFPRPQRAATRVVVTEYELPHLLLSAHDVTGDAKGNMWFTSHKTNVVGELDPRTGIVKEYRIPPTPGKLSGTHAVRVDTKHDIVWFSEPWAGKFSKYDQKTGQWTQLDSQAGGGNFGMGPDGTIWGTAKGAVVKMDPRVTGNMNPVQQWPLEPAKETSPYDNLVSADGNFWAGGAPGTGGHTVKLLDLRTGKLLLRETFRATTAARGGFDLEGNPWFGGRGGSIVTLNAKAGRIREYWAPAPYAPYTEFYEAMPDKNGEVWAASMNGRGYFRLNPKTERWIEYVLPEPYAVNTRTWVDNSTNPVSVWYIDYMGYIVRIQPLE